MASSQDSGTQNASIDTEHTLATVTSAGTYVLYVDANNMADGDVLELRVKLKVTSGGTTREFSLGRFANVQPQPVLASIPVAAVNEVVFTLTQTAGTGRSFPWEVVAL